MKITTQRIAAVFLAVLCALPLLAIQSLAYHGSYGYPHPAHVYSGWNYPTYGYGWYGWGAYGYGVRSYSRVQYAYHYPYTGYRYVYPSYGYGYGYPGPVIYPHYSPYQYRYYW